MKILRLLFGAKAAASARKVNRAVRVARAASAPLKRSSPVRLAGTGEYEQEIVGESFYQDALDAICGGKCEDGHDKRLTATLQPEPDNPHDRKAVAVILAGRKVGHLSRSDAADFHSDMRRLGAAAQSATCKARINGGWRRPRKGGRVDEAHYGVELDIDWPLERA